jgi:hypothetical protein
VGALWLAAIAGNAGAATPDEVRPAASPGDASARLELRGAFSLHDDRVASGPGSVSAHGGALSPLALGGTWFSRSLPIGVAGALALERFAFQPDGAPASAAVAASGLEASAALLARVRPAPRFALEGGLGYALLRVPSLALVVGPSERSVQEQTITAHGPALLGRGVLALHRSVDLEATAGAIPVSFGARSQGIAIDLRRYAAGADLRFGVLSTASIEWSLLGGYELAIIDGAGSGLDLHRRQHRIWLGLRAGMRLPPAPMTSGVGPIASVPPPISPPTGRGRVRGIVRAAASPGDEGGQPLQGVAIDVAGGATTRTDGEGQFVLEDMAPGLATLRLARDGFEPGEEVLSVPPRGGEVTVDLRLSRTRASRQGTLIGLVRSEDGSPVTAKVAVLELRLSARADRKGQFRFDVPPGTYTLTIEAPGFDGQRKTAVVGAAHQTIFNVDLQRRQ